MTASWSVYVLRAENRIMAPQPVDLAETARAAAMTIAAEAATADLNMDMRLSASRRRWGRRASSRPAAVHSVGRPRWSPRH